MTAVQMNIRIDATAKQEGDLVLDAIGFTPSRAVRALWRYAQRNRHNPQSVLETLEELEGTRDTTGTAGINVLERIERGPAIFTQAMQSLGVRSDGAAANIPYEDLLAAAYDEKQQGWDLP